MTDRASRNLYHLPFTAEVDVRPAPFHYKHKHLRHAVDFALNEGTPIFATAEGIVREVIDCHGEGAHEERFLGEANIVFIEHAFGEHSAYVHLQSGILVRKGERVSADQMIGYSGMSGFTSYPHLHYETFVNPENRFTIPTRFTIDGQVKTLVSPRE